MGGKVTYINGVITISNGIDEMSFPCNSELEAKIIKSIKEAYRGKDVYDEVDVETSKEISRLERINTSKAANRVRELEGCVKIGEIDGITLYVELLVRELKLFAFKYVSDNLPNKHGSIQVNVVIENV